MEVSYNKINVNVKSYTFSWEKCQESEKRVLANKPKLSYHANALFNNMPGYPQNIPYTTFVPVAWKEHGTCAEQSSTW